MNSVETDDRVLDLMAACRPFIRRMHDNKVDAAHQRITFDEFDQRNRAIWAEAAEAQLDTVIQGMLIGERSAVNAARSLLAKREEAAAEARLREFVQRSDRWFEKLLQRSSRLSDALWSIDPQLVASVSNPFRSGGYLPWLSRAHALLDVFNAMTAPQYRVDPVAHRCHVLATQAAADLRLSVDRYAGDVSQPVTA